MWRRLHLAWQVIQTISGLVLYTRRSRDLTRRDCDEINPALTELERYKSIPSDKCDLWLAAIEDGFSDCLFCDGRPCVRRFPSSDEEETTISPFRPSKSRETL